MKKVNKMKFGVAILAASLMVGTVSCKKKGCTDSTAVNYSESAQKDDGTCEYEIATNGNVVVAGALNSDQTWTADKIYELSGKVVVGNGITLTIEPGTIIKGRTGTGTLASALIIAQGGKINAVGTATNPIIFTSVLDNIQIGQFSGTNLDENDNGKWGGVILLGYAPISAQDGDVLSQIEGIPVTDAFGAFGGADAADNSGIMDYVSIRHGGALIGAGNEINGLTLGGVGTGTIISNIEVVANLDDGIEFFGGTVNVTNVLIGHQGDDGLDIDMNYAGTVENFIVVNGSSSDEAMEIDGPEGTTNTSGMFTLLNGNAYVFGNTPASADFKSKAQGTLTNVKFGTAKIRASYQNDCADAKTDAFTHYTDGVPTLTVNGEYTEVMVYTGSTDNAGANACTVFTTDQTTAETVRTNSQTTITPVDATIFSWTWMSVKGKM